MRWLVIAALAACGYVALERHTAGRPMQRGPGVMVAAAPVQGPLEAELPTFEKSGFRIKPLARFALEARVILRKDCCCDGPDKLAPVDVAFG